MTGDPTTADRLEELFESKESSLQSKFEEIRSQFDHSGLKGDEGEEIVREFLSEYLPRNYGYGNGEIIDSEGTVSREVDIAICNQFHPFTYSKDGRGLLFVEGVEAVVEVKSVLNEDHLERSIENCSSVRSLEANTPAGTMGFDPRAEGFERVKVTPHAVFAFETPYNMETLQQKLMDLNDEKSISSRERIDLVFCLDKGLIVDSKEIDRLLSEGADEYQTGLSVVDTSPSLLMFLILLQDKMPQVNSMPNILKQYIEQLDA